MSMFIFIGIDFSLARYRGKSNHPVVPECIFKMLKIKQLAKNRNILIENSNRTNTQQLCSSPTITLNYNVKCKRPHDVFFSCTMHRDKIASSLMLSLMFAAKKKLIYK